jgi:hypothetical protein
LTGYGFAGSCAGILATLPKVNKESSKKNKEVKIEKPQRFHAGVFLFRHAELGSGSISRSAPASR